MYMCVHKNPLIFRVSGNYEQIEGCLKSLFDSAMQFIPWIRLERAMATVTPAFQCNETTLEKPNGLTLSIGTTSLHSLPALGTWVSFHCPGAESASLRWMGHVLGWEWKIKLEHHPLQPEQKIGSDLFSGKKLMCQLSSHSLPDGRYSLLEGLTIKIAELNEKEVSREDNGENTHIKKSCRNYTSCLCNQTPPTTITALKTETGPLFFREKWSTGLKPPL